MAGVHADGLKCIYFDNDFAQSSSRVKTFFSASVNTLRFQSWLLMSVFDK
jgi:hypothetical protein